jgi:hypothetical protein
LIINRRKKWQEYKSGFVSEAEIDVQLILVTNALEGMMW